LWKEHKISIFFHFAIIGYNLNTDWIHTYYFAKCLNVLKLKLSYKIIYKYLSKVQSIPFRPSFWYFLALLRVPFLFDALVLNKTSKKIHNQSSLTDKSWVSLFKNSHWKFSIDKASALCVSSVRMTFLYIKTNVINLMISWENN
jgi:hypothetical protein